MLSFEMKNAMLLVLRREVGQISFLSSERLDEPDTAIVEILWHLT
jgi:hypothetical protein